MKERGTLIPGSREIWCNTSAVDREEWGHFSMYVESSLATLEHKYKGIPRHLFEPFAQTIRNLINGRRYTWEEIKGVGLDPKMVQNKARTMVTTYRLKYY